MEKHKDPLKHFPFYCHQYLGVLLQFSAEKRGVFISLLALYITEDGVLPCPDLLIRRLALFEANANQMLTECLPQVKQVGNEIILAQKEIREKRRKAGKLGGKSKTTDDKQKVTKKLAKRKQKVSNIEIEIETETNTDKDTINKNTPLTPQEKKGGDILVETPLQKVINCYLETKNKMPFSSLPQETVNSGYTRFGRAAKALLKDTNNNIDLICKAIRYLPVWADATQLDWSLETVSKAIAEPSSFKVNIPNLTVEQRKLIKTYLFMKGWKEDAVKALDLQKSKHTMNLIPVAGEILNRFNNDLDKTLSALEKYKDTLKEGQEFNIYFASKWIFENYGG